MEDAVYLRQQGNLLNAFDKCLSVSQSRNIIWKHIACCLNNGGTIIKAEWGETGEGILV